MEANLYHATGMLGASLPAARSGKALSDRPALEPDRGKTRSPASYIRGDDGNGGIIRSPIRVIVPPDTQVATSSRAGGYRLETVTPGDKGCGVFP
jgi:hypothetical protein